MLNEVPCNKFFSSLFSAFKKSLTLHSEVFSLKLLSILCHLTLKLIADHYMLWQLHWCWDQQHSPGDRNKALLSLQTFLNSLEAAQSRSWEACPDKSSVRRECPFLLAAVQLPGGTMIFVFLATVCEKRICSLFTGCEKLCSSFLLQMQGIGKWGTCFPS